MIQKKLKQLSKGKLGNIMLDVLIFLFGVILLISVYNVVQVRVLGNDYSSFFGYSIFEVQTGSMEPEISKGDWIIVKEGDTFELNDIVTFKQDENFITHRIIERYNETFITQGDANNKEDDPIVLSQIVGEVVGVIPLFGFFRVTLFNPYVLIALILTLYIFNMNLEGKRGNKMIGKIKDLIKKFINDKPESKKKDSFFADDDKGKSFENIEKKKFSFIEKVEDHSGDEFKTDEEKAKEERIEEELSKTMFFRKVTVNEDEEIEEVEDEEPEEVKEDDYEAFTNYIPEHEEEEEEIVEQAPAPVQAPYAPVYEAPRENLNDYSKITIPVDDEAPFARSVREEIEEDEEEEDDYEEEVIKSTPKRARREVKDTIIESDEIEESEDDEDEDKVKLEMIFSKPEHKKSKNIISRCMSIKEEEILEIIEVIMDQTKMLSNEASIKKALIKSYIESKYYNIFSDSVVSLESKKTVKKLRYLVDDKTTVISEANGFSKSERTNAKKTLARIGFALEEDAARLAKLYSGNDRSYEVKLEKYVMLMMLVAKLEYLITVDLNMKQRKILYAREIIKFISDYSIDNDNLESTMRSVIHSQKAHRSATKYFLEKLNTEMFELVYNQFKTDKNKFLIDLKHNLTFSSAYNDDIIDRTYKEGIVSENKLNVELALLQARLASDMISQNFSNEYLVYVPISLCKKESKLERLFRQNNEEYAKKNVLYLIDYDEFMKHSVVIKNLRKNGFRISALIGPGTAFTSKNKTSLGLSEYIFIDKSAGVGEIEKIIFDNFKDKIMKEDIYSKLEIVGEE